MPKPAPRITQITSLTWPDRIGSSTDGPERRAVLVGQREHHVVDAGRGGVRVEQDRGAAVGSEHDRSPASTSSASSTLSAAIRTVTGRSRSLVTVTAKRAVGAGEGDRRRRVDPDLAELVGRSSARDRVSRRRGGVRVGPAVVRRVRSSASSRTSAADRVVRGQQVLEGVAGAGSASRRGEVGGVELRGLLVGGVGQAVGIDRVAGRSVASRDGGEVEPGEVEPARTSTPAGRRQSRGSDDDQRVPRPA